MTNDVDRKNNQIRNSDDLNDIMTVEFQPVISEETFDDSNYTKLSLTSLATMGVAFQPLSNALQKIAGSETTTSICKVTIPKGTKLAKFKDGSGSLGTVLSQNNDLVGQARINPMAFDPTTLLVAATLASIDNKLNTIQELQKEILDFLLQKERSDLKGDLNFLTDILNNYKYNWDNDKYKTNNHIKVLDIKQEAERKIDLYIAQLGQLLKKKSGLFHSDLEVKKQLSKIQTMLKDYQLALYLFSFSSYLEVMLLENYDANYLEKIIAKIEKYGTVYQDLCKRGYDRLESAAKTSIESNLLKGLAGANKFAGKAIAKVPVISKSQIDETLIGTGDKIDEFGAGRIQKAMDRLLVNQESYITMFVDNITTVKVLYNKPAELIIDKDTLYIGNESD